MSAAESAGEVARVALVTGAARGIGAATVARLAADGCAVVALDACAGPGAAPYDLPTRADLEAVAAPWPRVVPVVADVRDRDAVAAAVALATGRWGRLDVVVAAAAVMLGGRPLWETDPAELDLLWDVDVKGVWHAAAAAVPAMLAGPDPSGCRVVAVASAAGSHGLYRLAGYTAVKHAVVGLVKGLAADLVGTGITAVAVSPGSTRTAMLERTAEVYGTSVEDLVSHQLLGRVIEPEEVAETIAFCASRSGAVLHGSVVAADGGFGA